MKKAIGCAVLLALLLTGCGGSKQAADPALKIGGVTIEDTLPAASVLDVLNGLGGAYEYAEAISCVYDGMDKIYTYENAVVYTYPDGGVDKLMELYCTGGDVQTAAGIALGDSRDKVVETYGDGYTEAGIVLSYEKETASPDNAPASLYFEFTDGKVSAIGITSEHRSE